MPAQVCSPSEAVMKSLLPVALRASAALGARALLGAWLLSSALGAAAQATPPGQASMVKPPPSEAPTQAGAPRSDPMPVKRPPVTSDGDKMIHNSPASDAMAK
jgi:hypothetical protein